MPDMLESRHIQNFTDASKLEPHWGYADRVVPCTSDAGSCAYLDTVYWAHDIGMIYTGIMWVAIIGVLLLWGIWYRARIRSRLSDTVEAVANRWLLTDFRATRFLFGRTTKLQLVVLGAIAAYLFIFSFAGFTYQTWVTPVKGMPGTYNTRTSLGPWSDRVGVLAFALTPLSILLASRESLLSVITGLPYHHFNFLHRWLGHIILAQSLLHSIGWCIIELRLYQPQPSVGIQWITQTYMIWGIVAMLLLLILWGLALPISQRLFGYEFFRKAHYVLAALYMGACIGHWQQLQCFIIPGLLLWATDRAIRLFRTALIHYRVLPNGRGIFQSIDAKITHFDGEVVRLDFESQADWEIGQHFFICFAKGGIWQSHPFTPLSLPGATQSYVFRAKKGETKRVVQQATNTTPVILTGPYGADITRDVEDETNVLCVAGGTGISFVLPVLLDLARREHTAQVKLIWAVRHANDAEWIERELAVLRASRVEVVVCPTRDTSGQSTPTADLADNPSSASPDESAEKSLAYAETGSVDKSHHRPDIRAMVRDFVVATETTRTTVFVSGPASLTSEVREEVARCNDPVKVWKGVREPVSLIHDERLE